ncbi:hypothetical protein R50073_49040 (plasmid) [Maricurvus nonylphenolicus]|jgi:DNA repair exonuclease SbcCD ATPase subunit|uniref:DNA-binding protein n=1 Tax=Maricurvus nonylphenolicus TaxID=1008307 RepID=UPI0036F28B06
MENIRLTEERVHALIKAYAAENAGEIPSSTLIIELNDGHGSLHSANKYRKTYIKQHPAAGAGDQDPFAGFPAAIAEAAKEMRATLESEAQAKIEAAQAEAAEKIQVMQEQLEDAKAELLSQLETDKTLRADLREAKGDNAALIDENQILRKRLEDSAEALNTCKVELVARQADLTGCRAQIEDLEAIRDEIAPLLRDQQSQLTALGEQSSTLADAAATLQNGQESSVETVKHLIESLSTGLSQEILRLAELTNANRDAIKAADHHHQQYQVEIARLNQTIEDQRLLLEEERQANIELAQDALTAKVEASHELMLSLVENVANLHNTLPSEIAESLKGQQGEA